jgi:inhibitor of lysozyme (Ivy)
MALVTMCVACSPATAADPNLSDVIKKPAYARALKSLLDHTDNLPSWTREVLKPKGAYVEHDLTYASIGGTSYEVFSVCEPHSCGWSALGVMFAPDGAQAWGALLRQGTTSYLGTPSEAQKNVLKEKLDTREDYRLSDVLKKPDYARALKNLFDQSGNLPSWTQEALKPKGYIAENVVRHANADRTTYEILTECMPHDKCEDTALVLMFAPKGTQAWGALFQGGTISYLGAPSDAQQAVLKEKEFRGNPATHLSVLIKKPAYAQALKNLFDHTANLSSWTREVLKPNGYFVEAPRTLVDGDASIRDVFIVCEPYNCDRTALVLAFAPNGTQAWGALNDDSHWPVSFLGAPSDAQKATLQEALRINRGH